MKNTRDIPDFAVRPGNVLDLSGHWNEIMNGDYHAPVLKPDEPNK